MTSWSLTVVRPQREIDEADEALSQASWQPTSYHEQLCRLQVVAFILKPDLDVYWPATEYLAEIGLDSGSATGDTVRTYAEALLHWFQHLETIGKDPADASLADLKSYRSVLLRGNGEGEHGYASTTAQIRFGTVIRFYRWSQGTAAFQSSLGASLQPSNHGGVPNQLRASRRTPTLKRFVYSRLPHIVTADEIRRITDLAPQPYSLMFRWAVSTGMRRFELCNLRIETLEYFAREAGRRPGELAKADIVRKGGRMRAVYVPPQLIDDTQRYILFERYPPIQRDEGYVFISRSGNRVSRSRLSGQFSAIAQKAGVSATLHHLRHTYAVVVLAQLQEKAAHGSSINPLKTLQILMGHAEISTTEIYLRAIEVNSAAVKEALAYLYGDVG